MPANKERFDLGLAVLHATRQVGHRYGLRDIAAFCGVSGEAIRQIEEKALRKLRFQMRGIIDGEKD